MTRRRYELTDHEWSILSPLLPNKPRGVPRVDDRDRAPERGVGPGSLIRFYDRPGQMVRRPQRAG